jgi:hypothetical protein
MPLSAEAERCKDDLIKRGILRGSTGTWNSAYGVDKAVMPNYITGPEAKAIHRVKNGVALKADYDLVDQTGIPLRWRQKGWLYQMGMHGLAFATDQEIRARYRVLVQAGVAKPLS